MICGVCKTSNGKHDDMEIIFVLNVFRCGTITMKHINAASFHCAHIVL
jgi:hypothetical protein